MLDRVRSRGLDVCLGQPTLLGEQMRELRMRQCMILNELTGLAEDIARLL
jgi:hypothetical protein